MQERRWTAAPEGQKFSYLKLFNVGDEAVELYNGNRCEITKGAYSEERRLIYMREHEDSSANKTRGHSCPERHR